MEVEVIFEFTQTLRQQLQLPSSVKGAIDVVSARVLVSRAALHKILEIVTTATSVLLSTVALMRNAVM